MLSTIMKKTVFLLLLLVPVSSFSQTKTSEVTTLNVQIFGKGIVDRKTGETIAFACVGAEENAPCKTLRTIYFNPMDGKSYYIGSPIELKSFDKKTVKKMLKQLRREYYDQNPTATTRVFRSIREWLKDDMHSQIAQYLGFTAAIMGSVVASGFFGPVAVPIVGLEIGIYFVGTGALLETLNLMGKITYNPVTKSTFQTLQDTNGWNWTIDPKNVSHTKFQKVFNFLNH